MSSLWTWILTLVYGTGAAVTPTPVTIPSGDTFIQAAKPLKPVEDTMRVGIDLGKITEEKKKQIISGSLNLREFGDIQIGICKTQNNCLPMVYSGQYFSRDSYGIAFDLSGTQLRGVSFVGVKVHLEKSLNNVVVNWSNYYD